MKITIDIPDGLICAFFNYVYSDDTGMTMGVKSINRETIYANEIIKVLPQKGDKENE